MHLTAISDFNHLLHLFTKIILPEKYVGQVVLMLQNQGHIF